MTQALRDLAQWRDGAWICQAALFRADARAIRSVLTYDTDSFGPTRVTGFVQECVCESELHPLLKSLELVGI
jgi:hypothetical protein